MATNPPPILGPIVLVSPETNLPKLLSVKSDHWSYENEWRLIVELNRTIGTGHYGPTRSTNKSGPRTKRGSRTRLLHGENAP